MASLFWAFGWTGEKALAFKVAYINAFNEMEAELRSRDVSADDLLSVVKELVAPLAVRFDGQDYGVAHPLADLFPMMSAKELQGHAPARSSRSSSSTPRSSATPIGRRSPRQS
jgi:hypothetical protein